MYNRTVARFGTVRHALWQVVNVLILHVEVQQGIDLNTSTLLVSPNYIDTTCILLV